MKTRNIIPCLILLIMAPLSAGFAEKTTNSNIKEENVTYTVGDKVYNGFIAWNENVKGKRPAVLVVHEWWGLTDYPKMRARKLAELGYIAMAVDLFGNGKIATNPTDAQSYTAPLYSNPQLAKSLLDAAQVKIKEYKQTDPAKVIAIGYCFGGAIVLNYAKLGGDLKAVVSFHGGLKGVTPDKDLLKAKILVCNGGSDKFVSETDIATFKHQMDSIGATYTFKSYPGALHAFTNPASTGLGKKFNLALEYNKDADLNSWNDMKKFLSSYIVK